MVNDLLKTKSEHFFVPLTADYLNLVLKWRNSERVRVNMHTSTPITQSEHENWFAALNEDQNRQCWIYCQHQRPVGVLNFSQVKTAHIEWGCYLGEIDILPGSGLVLEWAALNWAMQQSSCLTLDAEVLSFNRSALKLHKLFGYEKIKSEQGGVRVLQDCGIEEPYQVHFFSYATKKWKDEQFKVLARMPKPIQKAISQIQFLEKE
ncbi:UDP-4-amino-4,6-dideoxy-N-acetyl-beta-L-altrosamine N-acetyltransferase [Paraglaciecola sp. 2405UD69-4]|uniref:UDP-4-amino-4, 6-dideoxy-N-acetyl-beta-L-altrosamine N-acetyltransferase n=1 Tax=Paraglaciecola sp. 2405UD69-4 TaxID=3391836 RepID=UPI0039C8F357